LKTTLIVVGAVLLTLLAYGLWTPDIGRPTLQARYLDAPGDLTEVAGERLHVRDSGPKDASAVVLIHGFGASLHTWEPWARELALHHRVIRLDLPGCGLSEPDPTGDYTDARSVRLLLALLDQRGIERATLVGHSIGGRIAWTFAAQHPERIDKLVLIAPDGFASPGFEYGVPAEVPVSMQLMRHVLPRPLLRMSLEPAYADPAVLTDALPRADAGTWQPRCAARPAAADPAGRPAAAAAQHPGEHAAAVGRARRDDPVCQLGRLPAEPAACAAGALHRRGPPAARRSARSLAGAAARFSRSPGALKQPCPIQGHPLSTDPHAALLAASVP